MAVLGLIVGVTCRGDRCEMTFSRPAYGLILMEGKFLRPSTNSSAVEKNLAASMAEAETLGLDPSLK